MSTLPSYAKADAQDRIDILESDGDFVSDVNKALEQEQTDAKGQGPTDEAVIAGLDLVQRDFLRVRADFLCRRPAQVPKEVDRFFDQMVHDSHASFYMAGPATDYDRQQRIKEIQQKMARARKANAQLQRMGTAPRSATPTQDEANAALSLSDLERRIYEYQKTHNGAFPVISDADREQLLAMEDLGTSLAVRSVTNNTRRELGGHVRFRRILDRS